MSKEVPASSGGSWVVPAIEIIAAGAGIYELSQLARHWSGTNTDYIVLVVISVVMLGLLLHFSRRALARLGRRFASCLLLGTAASDSGMSPDAVRQLGEALRVGRDSRILPLMIKLLGKMARSAKQPSTQLGALAIAAEDTLAEGISQALVSLLKHDNESDVLMALSLASAALAAGLTSEDIQPLRDALPAGRDTGILPLMVKLLDKVVQLANHYPAQVGAPAKCADDGLADGLAKALLSLFKRENLTDILTTEKLELLNYRLATPAETASAIVDLPVFRWLGTEARDYETHRQEFLNAVKVHGLLSSDVFRTSHATYSFRFDMTNFCFDNIKPAIKIDMLLEARNRFKDKKFDTVVCLQRGSVNGYLNHFVQELANYMGATYCPLPTKEAERSEIIFLDKLQELCGGNKQTLLVEPLLLDDGELDKAYDFLQGQHATVAGVLILCQESHFTGDRLKNRSPIEALCANGEIKGQIVVDLRPIAA